MSAPPIVRARTGAVVARVLLVGYLLFVGFTVWLPAPVSARVTGLVRTLARWVADAGIASYHPNVIVLEFLANVALFAPIGLLLVLAWPRLRLWRAVLVGALMSVLIETVQGFMPSRFPTISDVVANTLGTLIGAVIVTVILSLAGVGRPPATRRLAA